MKCALCKDKLDTEHPDSVYCLNPETFRKAWMHYNCFLNTYDCLKSQKAKNIQFLNRQDEYNQYE